MHLIITRHHDVAANRIRHKVHAQLGQTPTYKGPSLPELLKSMPIITKQDLIRYGETNANCYLNEAVLFSETSGTTSVPLQTPRSKTDLGWNVINQMTAFKALVQPGADRVAVLHPSVLSPFVEGAAMALHTLGVGYVRIFPIPGVCDYRRIYDVLDRYAITTVMSTPALVYKLLYELKIVGNGLLPKHLNRILVTGERFRPESARNIERILGINSIAMPFVYGSSETAVIMLGAADCTYRPVEDDFVFEIIGSEEKTNDFVRGNLLVTWLRDGMLPVYRYDTGDIFTARRLANSQQYAFTFEGRQESSGLSIDQQNSIESVLYGLSKPIFHFECSALPSHRELQVVVFTQPESQLAVGEVQVALATVLHSDWKVAVTINPSCHSFLGFSPSPKINRFQNA